MITRLSVQHFRSVDNLDLRLRNINLLVGPNGSGKSNIIDAVKFVRDAVRNGLDRALTDRHGIQSVRQWSPTRPYHVTILIELDFKDFGHGSFSFTVASAGNEYNIRREEASWTQTRDRHRTPPSSNVDKKERLMPLKKETFKYQRDSDSVVTLTPENIFPREGPIRADADDLFINHRYAHLFSRLRYVLSNFETYMIFPNTLRQPQKQSNDIHLQSHGENLASVLKAMRKKKRTDAISEIISSMKTIYPHLKNISVQSIAGFLTPQFHVHDPDSNIAHTFNVNQMSDGTLRILGLLVALYQDPRPNVLALEEPEMTIHPGALQIISDAIREVSQKSQVIVTTHSPDFLDLFIPEQIISVQMKNNHTFACALSEAQVQSVKDRLFSLGELLSVEGLHG